MADKELTSAVRKVAFEHRADLVGFDPAERFGSAPKMCHPCDHMPKAKTVVV